MAGGEQQDRLERALLEDEGRASLVDWIAFLLPTERLLVLARQQDVSLKGFRPEKAPHRKLVEAVVKASLETGEVRQALLEELAGLKHREETPPPAPTAPVPAVAEDGETKAKFQAELVKLRGERDALEAETTRLTRLSESNRQRGREAAARAEKERKKRMRREAKLERYESLVPMAREAENLKRENDKLARENNRLRDALAAQAVRSRRLEEEPSQESEADIVAEPLVTAWEHLVAVPTMEEFFYDSLAEYDTKTVARIFTALFRVCQDPAHPSLSFKKMAGRGDIYSVRAAPDIRLYFFREGKGLRFLLVCKREEQDRCLRLIRERYDL